MNNFITDQNKNEYFLKLIPDLSIFDVIERYHIENEIDNIYEDKLYFYFNGTTETVDEFIGRIKNSPTHNNDCLISFKNSDFINPDITEISIECNKHGEEIVTKSFTNNFNIPFKRFILKTDDHSILTRITGISNKDIITYNFSSNGFLYYVFISNSSDFTISPNPENLYIGVCF